LNPVMKFIAIKIQIYDSISMRFTLFSSWGF
jgi:hypothetical protein